MLIPSLIQNVFFLCFACRDENIIPMTILAVGDDFFSPNIDRGGNVIVIFMDDIGVDKIDAYQKHPQPAYTPNINEIARRGIVFTNAYSNPTCSPSRTSILTGKHAYKTDIGRWIYAPEDDFDLQDFEVTLPELLLESPYDYRSVATGKWHLASFLREQPGLHPLEQGFEHHWGSLSNPLEAVQSGNLPRGYFNWEKNIDGELIWTENYLTTDTVNDAIYFTQYLEEPFFLYVPLNAPHSPLHVPPLDLLRFELTEESSDIEKYEAMIEAMDFEIGRFLESIPLEIQENTTFFLIGDNGTPMHGIREPFDLERRKGTVYDGGVLVPFIVWGKLVERIDEKDDHLIHLVDVFSTILDIAGVNPLRQRYLEEPYVGSYLDIDGESLVPLFSNAYVPWRDTIYTEGFYPNGQQEREYHKKMIRNQQWKYIRIEKDGAYEESFHEYTDENFDEGPNLLLQNMTEEALDVFETLQNQISDME